MTDMGETMNMMQQTAERIMAALGALAQPDIVADIETLQAVVKGSGDTELITSSSILSDLSTAYQGVERLILPSILAVESARHYATHWQG